MPTKISVSVSVNPELLSEIDERSSSLGYGSRSGYLRDLVRDDVDGADNIEDREASQSDAEVETGAA